MKTLLLLGAAALVGVVLQPAAHAQRFEFDYTGTLVTFKVPIDGGYTIVGFGAQGGNGHGCSGAIGAGGKGAGVNGSFNHNCPAARTMPDIPLDAICTACIDPPSLFAPTHVWLRYLRDLRE